MDYQQKYLKYKKKYLALQYELQGGVPPKPKILLFDLDDTLYSSLNGFSTETGTALVEAMSELEFYQNLRKTYKYKTTIPNEQQQEFMDFVSNKEYKEYATTYGISFGGLIKNCELGSTTVEQWQKKIVQKLKEKYAYNLLNPDVLLIQHLIKLKKNYELFIFTNSDDKNTEIILQQLKLFDIFPKERRITFDTLNSNIQTKINKICKNNGEQNIRPNIISKKGINPDKSLRITDTSHQTPFLEAIKHINTTLKLKQDKQINPSDIIFFDDSDKNILSALDTGLKTVYIQKVKKNAITNPQNITIEQQPSGNPNRSELSVFLDVPGNLVLLTNLLKS